MCQQDRLALWPLWKESFRLPLNFPIESRRSGTHRLSAGLTSARQVQQSSHQAGAISGNTRAERRREQQEYAANEAYQTLDPIFRQLLPVVIGGDDFHLLSSSAPHLLRLFFRSHHITLLFPLSSSNPPAVIIARFFLAASILFELRNEIAFASQPRRFPLVPFRFHHSRCHCE